MCVVGQRHSIFEKIILSRGRGGGKLAPVLAADEEDSCWKPRSADSHVFRRFERVTCSNEIASKRHGMMPGGGGVFGVVD